MLMGTIDVLVFLAYIVAVIVMGFWTGKGRRESTEDYFLAGRSLPWYAVGASFIGSNISTEHFIGMVGAAYTYGICVANWEWLNVWTFTILIWIFIPFLLGTRVFSAPEFLERRFNPTCRLLFAVLTVIASIGVNVTRGRLPGSMQFGCPSQIFKLCNRDPSQIPVSPALGSISA